MSALDIYGFYRDGDAFLYESVKNSWGGGWAIWKELTKKYDCKEGSFGVTQWKDLWDACTAGKLNEADTITCLFSFDWVWVKKENLFELARNLRAFSLEHLTPHGTLVGVERVLNKARKDSNIIGCAFNMSNIGEGLWYSYSGEDEDYVPYNILNKDRHWELFEELAEIKS